MASEHLARESKARRGSVPAIPRAFPFYHAEPSAPDGGAHIAVHLGIAVHTVKTHVHNLLLKLGLRSRLEVAIRVYAASRPALPSTQLHVA